MNYQHWLCDIPSEVWEQIASNGLPSLLMAIAVWWLQKGQRELVMELNKERSERIDALEAHVETCDKDRMDLRNLLLRHLGASKE
jgi:hypothetical protein